jgi:hypothetical protein
MINLILVPFSDDHRLTSLDTLIKEVNIDSNSIKENVEDIIIWYNFVTR